MSLQLWLPLNGDLTNNGLMDIEMNCDTPSWSVAGKIGKCANFDGILANVIYNNTTQFNYTDNFSFALWLYHTGATVQFAFTVGRADMGSYGYGVRSFSSTQIKVYFGGHNVDINCSANTWHHVAATIGNGQLKVYIDGTLMNTTTITVRPTYTESNGLGIGCFHHKAGDIYFFKGKINDFRIYDHCLSPKEVKEISKGLMLHYPLNNNGMGCKNYIKNSFNIKPSLCNSSNPGFSMTAVELDDDKFKGTFYKVSRNATGGGDFRIGWTDQRISIKPDEYNDKKVTFSVWVKSSTGTAFGFNLGRYSDLDISAVGSFVIKPNEWTKVSGSKTFLSTSANASAEALELYFHITSDTDVIMAQAKLEVSDYPTPWCPNEADELYSQLGMGENIEYDTSGYGNNALKTSVNYNSDSPRYQASTEFDGTTSSITLYPGTINSILAQGGSNPFTYSFWIKNAATDRGIIFGDHKEAVTPAFISIEKHLQNELRFYWNNGYIDWFCTNTTFPLNTWVHIVITYNGSKLLVYRNGILTDSKTITLNAGNKSSDNCFQIGRDSRTNNTMFEGNISDFRIYATCLSDSDIQELYNKPISIDNQGTMFATEINEEPASPVKFNKTGVVEADQIGGYFHNYFDYNGSMNTGIQKNVDVEKLIENNGIKLTCNTAVTVATILHRMQSLMFNGASGDFRVEFDAWSTNPVGITVDICDKKVATYSFNSTKQHFSGVAYSVNQYNTSSAYNGFFDIEAGSIPLGTEIYITNIVITKNTPKSIGSNYIVIDDIIEN